MKKQFIITKSIEVSAKPEEIFEVLIDVSNWHTWTSSVNKIIFINKKYFEIGSRFKVFQPNLLSAIWEVTDIEVDKSFTWISQSFGLTMIARHHIIQQNDSQTSVLLEMIYEGLLAKFFFKLTSQLTSNYMTMEINGLKKVCEQTTIF